MEQLINTDYNKNLTEKLIENDKDDIEKQQKQKYEVIENKISDIKEQVVDNIEEAINRKHNIDQYHLIQPILLLESIALLNLY